MQTKDKLYKVYKYASKNKDCRLFNYLTPTALNTVYMHEKIQYLNSQTQNGGALVDQSMLKYFDVIQIGYHGSLTNNIFQIPDNIYLIIPLCCGFYNYAIDAYPNFFLYQYDDDGKVITFPYVNDRVKEIINANEFIIKIGKNNYIILKPSQQYCDVSVSIDYHQKLGNIPMGIFDSYRYKFKVINIKLNEDVDTFTNDDFDTLINMERIRTRNYLINDFHEYTMYFESEMNYNTKTYLLANFLSYNIYNNFDEYIELLKKYPNLTTLNSSVLDQSKHLETRILNLSIIYNKCKANKTNVTEQNFVKEILLITKNKINKIIKDSINFVNGTTSYLQFIESLKNVFFKHLNYSIVSDLIKDQDAKYVEELTSKPKFMLKSDYDISNVPDIENLKLLLFNIYHKLTIVSKKDNMETGCYKYITDNNLDFTLQHILTYLSMRQKRLYPNPNENKLFAFNISCQGFTNKNVCENYKCLKHLHINASGIEYTQVFNQQSIKKLNEVFRIFKLDNYNYFNVSADYDHYVSQLANSLKLSDLFGENKINEDKFDEDKIEIMSKVLIWYLVNEYDKLFKFIINNFFAFSNGRSDLAESTNAIITHINLAITYAYFNALNKDQKYTINHLMDGLQTIV